MPTDLVQNSIQKVKKCSSITSKMNSAETRSEASEETRKEEDASSFNTDQINYRRMIEWCSKQRAAIEDTAANGQKRQAIQIIQHLHSHLKVILLMRYSNAKNQL